MPDMVIAANPGDGIRLTAVHAGRGRGRTGKAIVAKAALLGSDLVILAVNESQNEAQQLRTGKIESRKIIFVSWRYPVKCGNVANTGNCP